MDNVIDLSIPVAEVIEQQPEVLDVLVSCEILSGAWFLSKKELV